VGGKKVPNIILQVMDAREIAVLLRLKKQGTRQNFVARTLTGFINITLLIQYKNRHHTTNRVKN
jgi:hypothetical protein